jgi:hypothetical protein
MPEMSHDKHDFYVGYQPRATTATRTWIFRTVATLLTVTAVVALTLVGGQSAFPESRFDYGNFTPLQGIISEWPYPALVRGDQRTLLVAQGKHGFDAKGLDGATVSLRGARIGNDAMLEVEADSLRRENVPAVAPSGAVSLGTVTLTGEIVDAKCHFGVMNPGSGKVHRDCAARCISGGIPPGFLVRDAEGKRHTMLLTGVTGKDILDFVAEPVTISGELLTLSPSTLVLRIEGPSAIKRRE